MPECISYDAIKSSVKLKAIIGNFESFAAEKHEF